MKLENNRLVQYKRITLNGVTIMEHRLIIEKKLKRKLTKEEIVHHINGNKFDNRIENLQIMSRNEHSKHYVEGHFKEGHKVNAGKKYSQERKDKISKAHMGKVFSEETRKKMSENMFRRWRKIKNV